ncbi:acyl-CoA dehydrogenase family protein [Burkholderia orbicola]|uniref:acyl-CoA dehydrogenase family protein n=1 Tax=Burkholderia orbicola TaxID=2978683 RepID=UPI0039A67E41
MTSLLRWNFEQNEPEHVRHLRDMLRRFVAAEMPREAAKQWDKENHFPRDIFAKLGELGVMGLTVPEEYGGAGRDIVATMATIEELSKRSMAIAIPYVMATCYAGMNLVECGDASQKETLLPRVAAGDLIFAYGWTEPDVGSDLASVKTTAERDGDEIIVNGCKRFCSGADIADHIFTLVRSDRQAARYQNLSILLIPRNTPGVIVEPIDGMGLKGAATTDVTFADVRVSADAILGGPQGWNAGWGMITGSGLDVEKLEVAALALGIATAALEDAWTYSEERIQFGKAISNYQALRHELASAATQLHASRLMLYGAADFANRHIRCGIETSMTKLFVTETARDVTLRCQAILGAYGYVRDFDMERYVRDVLAMPIIGGSSMIQRNNIVNWAGLSRG